MIVVTGATGQLGRLVIDKLLETVPPQQIIAAVRNPAKARDLEKRGVTVRLADYDKTLTLCPAFAGAERLVMISANEVGKRAQQHRAIIDAAATERVKFIVYTSLLRADTSPLDLAGEHRETEAALRASGVAFVILRNGWYTENYAMGIPAALAQGVMRGCAGDGRIASAARADYAAAAVAVVTHHESQGNRVYELAGDTSYTLTEFAAEVAQQSGKAVRYKNFTEADYRAILVNAGLPEPVAAMLANSDAGAAKGGLFDDGRQLSRLIGRNTTPTSEVIAAALRT